MINTVIGNCVHLSLPGFAPFAVYLWSAEPRGDVTVWTSPCPVGHLSDSSPSASSNALYTLLGCPLMVRTRPEAECASAIEHCCALIESCVEPLTAEDCEILFF